MNPYIRDGDNPDITKEREKSSFNVERFSEYYHGGKENLKMRRDVENYIESRPGLREKIPTAFLSREELVENSARKLAERVKHDGEFNMSNMERTSYFQSLVHVRDTNPYSLHDVMFLPVLLSQASEEQVKKWAPMAISKAMCGTYAQTELGHGTNLSKLETTATYDNKTQQFVLNTPKVSATKWWPGSMGKFCNHAIVVAILFTNEENKGPHPFLVQLRDMETHKVLPNIKLGDIGPKYGINGSDNGYLILNNYRIPRENMLMKYSKVLPDGEYVKPPHSKLAYGGMVYVRSMMVRDIANHLAIATTIATRYSSVRRQGEISPGKGEVQILDYQTQQLRVFPHIARTIAFRLAGQQLRNIFNLVSKDLSKGDTSLLPELHALSSGLKAVVTFEVGQGIEQCRLSCGGHGYSQASAFPELFAFSVAACTYEGDNIVLLQQVAKFLVKAVGLVRNGNGSQLAQICEYLNRKSESRSQLSSHFNHSNQQIINDFETVTRKQVFRAYDKLKSAQSKMSNELAWNSCAIELCKASRWHVRLYIIRNFFNCISSAPSELSSVLQSLAKLYAFDLQTSSSGSFLEDNYMTKEQINELKEGIYFSLAAIRPNAVSIVDGFALHEIELKSVLGRRDGNVYTSLFEWAQNSSLNRQEVLPMFDKYLGPMMKAGRSML